MDPTTKIYPELAKKSGNDNEVDMNESGEMEKHVFDMKEEDGLNKKNKHHGPQERQGFWARLCRRGANKNKIGAHARGASNMTRGEHDLLMESFDSVNQPPQNGASGQNQGES